MFYRQKVLLALTEVFGRSLRNTDFQKLLFLFCKETQENYYSFFPYRYGAYSFMSYYDKRKLVEKGFLEDKNYIQLKSSTSFLGQLTTKDQTALQKFAKNYQNLRGRELIRKSYIEYPEYASKSKISNEILTPEEQRLVHLNSNNNSASGLFTIGYEGKTIDYYIQELIFSNIHVLIDVRRNPVSRKHGFSKKGLGRYLEKVGIKYLHFPELGVASHLRKNLDDALSYDLLFEQYVSDTIPQQVMSINKISSIVNSHRRVALTCFEADPSMCHRHKLAESLERLPDFNSSVIHI